MKKILASSIIMLLVLALVACGESDTDEKDNETKKESASVIPQKDEVTQENTDTNEETITSKDTTNDKSDSIYLDSLVEDVFSLSEGQTELSQESYDFLRTKTELFPAKTDENINEIKKLAKSIDSKMLNKNPVPYYSSMLQYEGYVVQIHEQTQGEEVAAVVNVADGEGNNYIVFIYKDTGDIYEEDYVRFWGVPVGTLSYNTLDGGSQIANIFMGSHIEKAQ